MLARLFLAVFFSLVLLKGKGQNIDFSKADSLAVGLGKADSISLPDLSYKLTNAFQDPILKTRAIYTWIAYNISYDCLAFHNISSAKSEAADIYRLRKGVCGGYANLFQAMCSYANVQCLTIDGYARNGANMDAEDMDEPNHTWNAVRINGEWRLIDVTWSSGFTDKKVKKFTQRFSDTYFFPEPEKFLLNHYPRLDAWRLCKSHLSKKTFFQNPAVLDGYLDLNMTTFEPRNKKLVKKKDAMLGFAMTFTTDLVNTVTVILGEDKKAVIINPEFEKSGNALSFIIPCNKVGSFPLIIILNHMPCLEYQLEVQDN
jgi:hypothetical protein